MKQDVADRLYRIWSWLVRARIYASRAPIDDVQWLIDDYKRLDRESERVYGDWGQKE